MFGTWLGSALATINPDDPDSALWHIPAITYFLGRELVWWFLVSVMTAIVLAFSQTSPIVRAAIGALQRSSGIMGNGHLQERSQPASTSLGEESS